MVQLQVGMFLERGNIECYISETRATGDWLRSCNSCYTVFLGHSFVFGS